MTTSEYLDRLLLKYSNTFDIYKPYRIGAKEYPAYGYFFSHNEKYILVKEANMWTMDSYEHILFMEVSQINHTVLAEAEGIIKEYMEAQLVRKGQHYPDKSHMSSILTVAIIGQEPLSKDIAAKIHKYKFDKGYQFNFRGFSRGRILAVTMDNQTVSACFQSRDLIGMYQKVFQDVKDGQKGFEEACAEQGIKPFLQKPEMI